MMRNVSQRLAYTCDVAVRGAVQDHNFHRLVARVVVHDMQSGDRLADQPGCTQAGACGASDVHAVMIAPGCRRVPSSGMIDNLDRTSARSAENERMSAGLPLSPLTRVAIANGRAPTPSGVNPKGTSRFESGGRPGQAK